MFYCTESIEVAEDKTNRRPKSKNALFWHYRGTVYWSSKQRRSIVKARTHRPVLIPNKRDKLRRIHNAVAQLPVITLKDVLAVFAVLKNRLWGTSFSLRDKPGAFSTNTHQKLFLRLHYGKLDRIFFNFIGKNWTTTKNNKIDNLFSQYVTDLCKVCPSAVQGDYRWNVLEVYKLLLSVFRWIIYCFHSTTCRRPRSSEAGWRHCAWKEKSRWRTGREANHMFSMPQSQLLGTLQYQGWNAYNRATKLKVVEVFAFMCGIIRFREKFYLKYHFLWHTGFLVLLSNCGRLILNTFEKLNNNRTKQLETHRQSHSLLESQSFHRVRHLLWRKTTNRQLTTSKSYMSLEVL